MPEAERRLTEPQGSREVWRRGIPPVMMALAGDSGTGKTTFTAGIVEALGRSRITEICLDDYHNADREERKSLPYTPLDAERCNDLDFAERQIADLRAGLDIPKPVYDHDDGQLKRPVRTSPNEFIVIEGLHPLFTRNLRRSFDTKVYLDPDEEARIQWKYRRDMVKRGYTPDEVAAELEKRAPESRMFIHPQRRFADMVISFAPLRERGETVNDPLSVTILLRPNTESQYPKLAHIIGDDHHGNIHLKQVRDPDTQKPEDALHIHSRASRDDTREVEEALWREVCESLGTGHVSVPETLGIIAPPEPELPYRSEPLAIAQLVVIWTLAQAKVDA